ncbi:MAG TPA: hypothetical protein VF546_19120 [Pyrinomonadaceae bacterium]|jgi:hypothetical protein
MNELLSWGLVVGAVVALIALGFNALQVISSNDEFWIARLWFVLAAIVAAARIIYWALTTHRSLALRLSVCIVACGVVSALAVESVRYVNRKHSAWTKLKAASTQALKSPSTPQPPESRQREVVVTPEERLLAAKIGGASADELKALQVREEERAQPRPEPILVCKTIYVTPVYWTGFKFILEEKPNADPPYALIAEFVNRPNAKGYVPPVRCLYAQMYYDRKRDYYGRAAYAHWLGEEVCYCDLDAGGEALLIVAVGHRGGPMYAVSNPDEGVIGRREEKPPLKLIWERFHVQAHLSGSLPDETATVYFEIGVKPGELPTIKVVNEAEA